ncbi:hypothetical protein D7W82_20450 [Corallococcus sp. CA049B]|uniref:hypothetical protein n=1 Tax=unclassified Corallococcus TaxID=2685029 RepID=UPI000EA0C5EC|nr:MULTISPECIES: hypothetical protein [unclassified Corallococcus]NOJ97445.1 hypothetical protein [Corallococcus coralloides]RKG55857.1 hypothetical protein D7X30_25260 [Corallococcus sp. AB011P]RKG85103.1 hypothetical protein D7W82_20450 [Corallococcus sp. CA049B]RKH81089.1 hypothetical protein D7Y21_30975 [Corallococcus sp. AB045]
MPNVGQELLNVPMGDMIREMATAIAEAQLELDKSGMLVAEMMSGEALLRDADGNIQLDGSGKPIRVDTKVSFAGTPSSMMELGFAPNFYQFVDTIIEVKIAIKMTESTESKVAMQSTTRTAGGLRLFKRGGAPQAVVTTVDASYTRKYDYSVEGSSLLRTKLVPVPPPALFEERVRALIASRAGTTPTTK